jgi:phosphate transport system ATP-binding protein
MWRAVLVEIDRPPTKRATGRIPSAGEAPNASVEAQSVSVEAQSAPAIDIRKVSLWYGTFQALFEVDLEVRVGSITALIGPSGCGKSTLLRSVNRINERLGDYVRTTGSVHVHGHDVLADGVELVQLRKQIGMVFQRPNPLPLSIRDNVLFAHRLHRAGERFDRADEDAIMHAALSDVLLWDEVKDHLDDSATALSLEAQQKLCIARLLPVKPKVILMDEPTSALDPRATEALEHLIWELKGRYTVLIVTHNMAQARRASDETAFMLLGRMVEHRRTDELFLTPREQETADYIEGRYG